MNTSVSSIKPEFVEFMPEEFSEGVLYISLGFQTAIHLCACGCGNQVITPFSKNGWLLSIHDDLVTLSPSIGNWQFLCKSHYWIVKNKIIRA